MTRRRPGRPDVVTVHLPRAEVPALLAALKAAFLGRPDMDNHERGLWLGLLTQLETGQPNEQAEQRSTWGGDTPRGVGAVLAAVFLGVYYFGLGAYRAARWAMRRLRGTPSSATRASEDNDWLTWSSPEQRPRRRWRR